MTLEDLMRYFPLVGWIIPVVFTLVFIPFLARWYRQTREYQAMVRRRLFEQTEVVLFGVFDGRVQYDPIGSFPTTFFGERLFGLIVRWNDTPSPSIIIPTEAHTTERLKTVIRLQAPQFILQAKRLDCYFRGAREFGSPSYRFAKFVACVVRPDADKLTGWHDCPRIVLVELGTLEQLHSNLDVQPTKEDEASSTWLETLRQIARMHSGNEHKGLEILEIPV